MQAGVERIDSLQILCLVTPILSRWMPYLCGSAQSNRFRAFCEMVDLSNGRKFVPDLKRETTAVQFRLRVLHEQAACAAHHSPVVFVGGSTSQADLIVPPVLVDARPGEAVRAALAEKQLQQLHGFT